MIRRRLRETLQGLLLSAPAVTGLLIFVFLPFALSAAYSLTDQRLVSPKPPEYVGLQNYRDMLGVAMIIQALTLDPSTGRPLLDADGAIVFPDARSAIRDRPDLSGFRELLRFTILDQRVILASRDPTFWRSLVNTIVATSVIVLIQAVLGLLLALIVSQRLRGMRLFRAAFFVPVVTSIAIMSVVWKFVFNPKQGLLNGALSLLPGVGTVEISWLQSTKTALASVLIVTIWQGVGVQMMLFLSGLQSIPPHLYEAATIDGAGTWHRFRYVTLPGLRTTTTLVVVTLAVFSFRMFTQVDILTKGGPSAATTTLFYHIIQTGFVEQRIGYAAAVTVVLFALVTLVVVVLRRLLRSDDD